MTKRTALGGAIKAIREAKAENDPSFRLSAFATKCLISPAHLCNIEAGRKPATAAFLERLADQLGVPVQAISYVDSADRTQAVAA